MPVCSRCRRRSDVYVVSSDSDRCASYVLAGSNTKYDVFGPSSSEWNTLERTERKIADDLKEARGA